MSDSSVTAKSSPRFWVPVVEGLVALVLGIYIVLAPADTGGALARITLTSRREATIEPAAVGERLVHSPQIGLVDLVDAVLRGRHGTLRLDRGPGRGYHVELTPA